MIIIIVDGIIINIFIIILIIIIIINIIIKETAKVVHMANTLKKIGTAYAVLMAVKG
jgi:hypothetical protein